MSALAKVFVVVVFVLSLIFFGTSATLYQTRRDWRGAYDSLSSEWKAKKAELENQIKSQQKAFEAKDAELAKAKATAEDLDQKLRVKDTEIKERDKKVLTAENAEKASTELSRQLSDSLKTGEAAYATLQQTLDKTKAGLDAAIVTAREANERRDSMRLDLEKTQQELHVARTEYDGLSEKLESLEMVLAAAKERGVVIPAQGAPRIDAIVKGVRDQIVLLSVGKDQKVEEGYEFTVFRGSDFIGKVKVFRVFPDLAGAQVVYTKDEKAEIRAGDRASTSISI